MIETVKKEKEMSQSIKNGDKKSFIKEMSYEKIEKKMKASEASSGFFSKVKSVWKQFTG